MAWTAPRTWTDVLSDSSHFNVDIRDNMLALKDPPSANYEPNEGSNYTSTNANFVDIDGTNLSLTITTNGGDVMVCFSGSFLSTNVGYVDIAVDGTRIINQSSGGLLFLDSTLNPRAYSLLRLVTGLSAGSHTFKLQWKSPSGGTLTLYAGAGTANYDLHPQFWVREVS